MLSSAQVLILLSAMLAQAPERPTVTVLRYEVVQDEENAIGAGDMENLVAVLERRVNPGVLNRVFGRIPIDVVEGKYIEIGVPSDRPELIQRIQHKLTVAGTLEFRILANGRDHAEIIERAIKSVAREIRDGDNRAAWWIPVQPGREKTFKDDQEIATRRTKRANRDDAREDGETLEILVVADRFNVNGSYLRRARAQTDRQTAIPCVGFEFNADGGRRFAGLTSSNLPDEDRRRKLGIIINGQIYSAPIIMGTVSTRGQITGSFTQQEVDDLVAVLNSGTLPARLRLVSKTVEPAPIQPPRADP
ncbi:MAG: hypothetical protein HQ581_04265 [Planctomycetes bacterium]|nr:hypothetical protein [Planctomycetota bacterium]